MILVFVKKVRRWWDGCWYQFRSWLSSPYITRTIRERVDSRVARRVKRSVDTNSVSL